MRFCSACSAALVGVGVYFAAVVRAAVRAQKPLTHARLKLAVADYNLHIIAPSSRVTLPVIFFIGGFSGDAPISGYSKLLTGIAERGFIIAGLDRFGVPNYPRQANGFLKVLDWALAGGLHTEMTHRGFEAVPDVVEKVAVMGQSEGNHVIGQALVYSCSIAKALVMLDPVDGYDPYRLVKSQDLITPGHKLNFTVPTLILDNALDPQRSRRLFPSCDPYLMGTSRFFPAMSGPVWNLNATAYGHADCLNDELIPWAPCKSDPSTNKTAYRVCIAEAVSTFLDALFERTPNSLANLEGKSICDIELTVRWDLKGLRHGEIRPGCTPAATAAAVPEGLHV